MKPRLVVLSGPFEGHTFALTHERLTIGRHPSNDLGLPSIEISRRHCEVRRDADGGFLVRDLESRHGTFVNSRPVREWRLEHSDLLTVGTSVFLFLVDDSVSIAETPSEEVPLPVVTTVLKQPGDALYLDHGRVDAALPAQAKMGRNLNTLLQVATAVQRVRGVEELAQRLLELTFEVVPAVRGAVLLREPGVEEPRVAAWLRRPPEERPFTVSRTLSKRVFEGGAGLLATDVDADAEVGTTSVRRGGIRSLLAMPLSTADEVFGFLYFDTSTEAGGAFGEHHLELVTAIAGIASPAFENAFHLRWLERENRRLVDDHLAHEMVGESAAMKRVLELLARVARVDSTVLVRGESGTGKELVARAIHRSSPRAGGPFVAINCATLTDTLFESELFGHEKGAFTGAVAKKLGKLELADRGTLFLDEIGEVPPALQAKLLRVLQERKFERVGGTRPIPVDVRLVAATNRDLEAATSDGTFREDLYYRLNVITLTMPPLTERRNDVPLLASHFAALHGRRLRRRVVGISPEARRALLAYDWPGNVRELGNAIERAVVLGEDDVIRLEDLPDEIAAAGDVDGGEEDAGGFQTAVVAAKKRIILDAYKSAGGDYGEAARNLRVHVNSLHRMIRNLGLKPRLGR